MDQFDVSAVAPGVTRIVDVPGNHCYLVEGESRALLVDSCGGFGNLRACVDGLTSMPLTVALTHGHEDHMMGSYWFGETYLLLLDGGAACWDGAEERTNRIYQQICEEGLVAAEAPLALRDGTRPREMPARTRRRRTKR